MACTEAVEEVIVEHYESQAKFLKGVDNNLSKITKKFANDEKDHMIKAKNYGTGSDPLHKAFKVGVKNLSKIAIRVSEKL